VTTSPTGWLAVYWNDRQLPTAWLPVEAWGRDGEPLVVDTKLGNLVNARSIRGFAELEKEPEPFIAALPAAGWRLHWEADGESGIHELMGFAVRADGEAIPIRQIDGDRGEAFGACDGEAVRLLEPGEDTP
jgi:hypothetical protein